MKEILKNLKFHNLKAYILLVLWVFMLFCFRPWDDLKEYLIEPQGAAENSTQVYGYLSVKQSFQANGIFDSVDIYMDNYNHTYEGSCMVKISDASGGCIYEEEVDKSELGSGWLEIHIGHIIQDVGDYQIEITAPDLKKDNCVIVYYADEKTYGNGEMTLYGCRRNKTICFSVYDSRRNFFAYVSLFLFFTFSAIWWNNRKKSILCTAFIILTGTGLSMLIVMAPMSVPDEYYHYNSSFVLSNVLLGKSDVYGYEEEYFDFEGLLEHRNVNSAYIRVMEDIFERDPDLGEVVNRSVRIDELRHPIIYLAPACAVALGRRMGFNFVQVYYLGCLFHLMLYIFLVLAAIKLIPVYKELLLIIAALPMSMQQAASFSYDVIINAMSFVLVAYVMKLTYEKAQVEWKDILLLTACGGILCPNKIVYSVLLLLVFMIPGSHFKGLGDRGTKLAVIFCGAFLIVAATQLPIFQNLLKGGQAAAAARSYGVQFMLEHPWKYAKLLYETLRTSLTDWVRYGVGSSLAGVTLPVCGYLIWGFLILMAASCFQTNAAVRTLSAMQKVICSLTVFSGIIFIEAALSNGKVFGQNTIPGIQGRYFIPYFLPAFFAVHTKKITVNIQSGHIFCVYWFLWAGVLNTILSNVVF